MAIFAATRGSRWQRPLVGALAALVIALCICRSWGGDLGFSSSLTSALVEQLAHRFGAEAKTRLSAWQDMLRTLRLAEDKRDRPPSGKAERDILQGVNSFFNRIPFLDDLKHWGVEDYWATPAEMLASNGADCEDYAIAKYFALKEIGIPVARLRITYVKATRPPQPHMVLAYYASPDADPLILDNLDPEIRPATQRPDLIPVYSFNDDDIWLARSNARAGSPTQIRLWRGLLDRLDKERHL